VASLWRCQASLVIAENINVIAKTGIFETTIVLIVARSYGAFISITQLYTSILFQNMGPASNENLKEGKRKSRLSSIFSSNKHNDTNPDQELEPNHHDQLEAHDSAYGGSEQNSAANSASNVPTITDTEANAQGAKVTTSVDRTGRTITTTTTTTTTTVTTLGGKFLLPQITP
jgi:hypothetical protein